MVRICDYGGLWVCEDSEKCEECSIRLTCPMSECREYHDYGGIEGIVPNPLYHSSHHRPEASIKAEMIDKTLIGERSDRTRI